MKDKLRRALGRVALCVIVLVIVGTVGAVVCQSGRVRVLSPDETTEAQLLEAIKEARAVLHDAGRSQAEIDKMVFEFRCRYLPESTEGCDDEESGMAQGKR